MFNSTTIKNIKVNFDEAFKKMDEIFDNLGLDEILGEEKDQTILEIEAPGISKENLSVNVENGFLLIKATSENEARSFEKKFELSTKIDLDSIKADFKDGLLKITMNSVKKDERSKNIKIL